MDGCGCVQMVINANLDIVYLKAMFLKVRKKLSKKKVQPRMNLLIILMMKEPRSILKKLLLLHRKTFLNGWKKEKLKKLQTEKKESSNKCWNLESNQVKV